jgi:hypothetical protein
MVYSPPKCTETETIRCLLKLLPPAERLSVSLNSGGVPRREEGGRVDEKAKGKRYPEKEVIV